MTLLHDLDSMVDGGQIPKVSGQAVDKVYLYFAIKHEIQIDFEAVQNTCLSPIISVYSGREHGDAL